MGSRPDLFRNAAVRDEPVLILSDGEEAAPAFSGPAVIGIIGFGLVAFAAFTLLLGFSGGPETTDGQAHALSRSAVGFAGIVQLMREAGTPVLLSRKPLDATGADGGLLILTPDPGARAPSTMPDLGPRTILIVLPKWHVYPNPTHAGWVEQAGLLPVNQVLGVLPADWKPIVLHRNLGGRPVAIQAADPIPAMSAGSVDRLQTFAGEGWTPLLHDGEGGIVLGRQERGPYVLADPDLLNDLALAEIGGAAQAVALLKALAQGRPIAFDISLNGYGRSRNLLRLIVEPPLLGATLCALASAALVGLMSIGRFGPVKPSGRPLMAGKRALADNAATLIALAGREHRMALPYAELTRSLAARATSAPRHLDRTGVNAHLDRAADLRGLSDRFTTLREQAASVHNRAGLMRVARRLYNWRIGLTPGRT